MSELSFIGKSRELTGKSNPFADTTVAVTGTFNAFTRDGIPELLASLGAKTTDHISGEVDYLLYGAVSPRCLDKSAFVM